MKHESIAPKSSQFLAKERQRLESEIELLRNQLQRFAEEIDELQLLAGSDALTNIANRRIFDQQLTQRTAELNRFGNTFCLLMIDIDNLKTINDQFGHATGDALLSSVGKALAGHLRDTDVPARVGGDEFMVILPGTDLEHAKSAAQRIIEEVIPGIQQQMQNTPVSFSIGVAQAMPHQPPEELYQRVDRAMYAAKKKGGNQYVAATENGG